MLDEPSMGLAPILRWIRFFEIIQSLHKATTILLVEQNAQMALSWRTEAMFGDGEDRRQRQRCRVAQ